MPTLPHATVTWRRALPLRKGAMPNPSLQEGPCPLLHTSNCCPPPRGSCPLHLRECATPTPPQATVACRRVPPLDASLKKALPKPSLQEEPRPRIPATGAYRRVPPSYCISKRGSYPRLHKQSLPAATSLPRFHLRHGPYPSFPSTRGPHPRIPSRRGTRIRLHLHGQLLSATALLPLVTVTPTPSYEYPLPASSPLQSPVFFRVAYRPTSHPSTRLPRPLGKPVL